ncbi:TRAP transporter small permease [Rhizobium oryziradicis]|uniref:TRAP transporter small permease protein n=1 Tax=Rhizobium oryziradicis TaxID=1867956 RepID=A0A1Q8ZMK9_9HYPH|nr:TRAP transporter small permease subunit [Rhizobium oryziradicis]OLP43004.1 C4-dicarboxylate ABC transporter permease [Rhizobium oryziradicis]
MKTILSLYDRLIFALAYIAAASLALVTVIVALDVIMRNLNMQTLRWISAVVEYVLLFSTMAAAPWLVRINGHVSLSSFVNLMPRRLQTIVGELALVVSALSLAFLGIISADLTVQRWMDGSVDMRSVNLPAWLLYAFLAVGFVLMACEFVRLLLRGELYNGAEGNH